MELYDIQDALIQLDNNLVGQGADLMQQIFNEMTSCERLDPEFELTVTWRKSL